MKSQYYATLLGLVLGDAMGSPIEYEHDRKIEMTELSDAEKLEMVPGLWTIDTASTLCLHASLLQNNGLNLKDQLLKYAELSAGTIYNELPVDLNDGIYKAIKRYQNNEDLESFDLSQTDNSSLVRSAAIALFNPNIEDLDSTLEIATRSSFLTHGSQGVADCCRVFVKLLVCALNGYTKEELLSPKILDRMRVCNEIYEIFQRLQTNDLDELVGYDDVFDSLEYSLKVFAHTENFSDGLLLAVNKSLDSNTIGAIYGQLAGAYYGLGSLKWTNQIYKINKLIEAIDYGWNRLDKEETSTSYSFRRVIKKRISTSD